VFFRAVPVPAILFSTRIQLALLLLYTKVAAMARLTHFSLQEH
jgi:hypothetical protein